LHSKKTIIISGFSVDRNDFYIVITSNIVVNNGNIVVNKVR